MRVSYRFWLAVCLLSLVILLYDQFEIFQSSWETYSPIGKNKGQNGGVASGNTTSTSVVAVQEAEYINFTASTTLASHTPPSNPPETPASPAPSDKIIVAGTLITENTTWIVEELSELVLCSSVIQLNSY